LVGQLVGWPFSLFVSLFVCESFVWKLNEKGAVGLFPCCRF